MTQEGALQAGLDSDGFPTGGPRLFVSQPMLEPDRPTHHGHEKRSTEQPAGSGIDFGRGSGSSDRGSGSAGHKRGMPHQGIQRGGVMMQPIEDIGANVCANGSVHHRCVTFLMKIIVCVWVDVHTFKCDTLSLQLDTDYKHSFITMWGRI
jgi:hypothetical protein